MNDEIKNLKKEIEAIKLRNQSVEQAKAWEISLTRKVSIVVLTYLVMVLVFIFIKVANPFLNAVIPTLGYFLSTFSMGVIKNIWIRKK